MTEPLVPGRVARKATRFHMMIWMAALALAGGTLIPTATLASPRKDRTDAQRLVEVAPSQCDAVHGTDSRSAQLHDAAVQGDAAQVRGLLKEGVRPGFVDSRGRNSLMIAARDGNRTIVRYLLKAGASVRHLDNHRRNVLHHAAMGGNVSVVKLLAQYPELKEGTDWQGQLPVHLAADHGHFGATRSLLDVKQLEQVDHLGRSLVFHAYMGGNLSLIKYLRGKRAPASLQPKDGSSLFLAVVQSDNLKLVQRMLGRYDVNDVNRNGETALYLAALKGRSEIVDFLLSEGATPAVQTKDGRNLLMAAARLPETTLLKRLMTGIDINLTDHSGRTALFDALEASSREAVALLLRYGANPNVADSDGVTPIEIAVHQSDVEMVQLLLRYDATPTGSERNGESLLMTATRIGNEQIVGELLGAGASISTVGRDGTTLLMVASQMGMTDFVRLLLQWGQNAAATNQSGESALDMARAFNHQDVVSILEQQIAALKE